MSKLESLFLAVALTIAALVAAAFWNPARETGRRFSGEIVNCGASEGAEIACVVLVEGKPQRLLFQSYNWRPPVARSRVELVEMERVLTGARYLRPTRWGDT